MKARAAVILIQNEKIALIERHRSGRHYFVFPGGTIEPGETPEVAAQREIMEELGLDVKIGMLVAEVRFRGSPQYYFLAERIGGQFGHGTGDEMDSPLESEKGSHHPVWLRMDDLAKYDVIPKLVAEFVLKSRYDRWSQAPLIVNESSPEEPH